MLSAALVCKSGYLAVKISSNSSKSVDTDYHLLESPLLL